MAKPDRQTPPYQGSGPAILRIPAWASLGWLQHGFSTRHGGVSTAYSQRVGKFGDESTEQPLVDDLNLGWTKEDPLTNVRENRRRLVTAICGEGRPAPKLVTLRQVHSSRSLAVPNDLPTEAVGDGQPLCEGDGLMTATAGLLLGIQTADCVPILIVDRRLRAVAAFHAGWRGTVGQIVERGIATLTERFGSRVEDLSAAIGPAIGLCCYTVGEEVFSRFGAAFTYSPDLFVAESSEGASHPATWRLDLWEANRRQLIGAGLAAAKITVVARCTACSGIRDHHDKPTARRREFFSYRAEGGVTGRMMSVIGIAGDSAA